MADALDTSIPLLETRTALNVGKFEVMFADKVHNISFEEIYLARTIILVTKHDRFVESMKWNPYSEIKKTS